MDNFFGLGTANAFYDKRRHVNLVFYTMMMLRLMKKENSFMVQLKQILSSGYDKNARADKICEYILTDYEISYLNYLRSRYNLNEDEYAYSAGSKIVIRTFKSSEAKVLRFLE